MTQALWKIRENAKHLRQYQARAVEQLKTFFARDRIGRKGYLSIAPGGGKTLTANTFVHEHYLQRGKRVLWLAWDWFLLEQAIHDLHAQYLFNPSEELAFVGTRNVDLQITRDIPRLVDWGWKDPPQVIYSSVQTIVNPTWLASVFRLEPALVVIDEAHYGKGGQVERQLFEFIDQRSTNVLGLTGTPKARHQWTNAADRVSFHELVLRGHLAKPNPIRVPTGSNFSGTLVGSETGGQLISPRTYTEIASDRRRNRLILETYRQSAARYGKTIVYACNVEHANALFRLFSAAHYTSVVIHGEVDEPRGKIRQFRDGHYNVAIGVKMLKQGVDLPDVKTIFLCAPTTSDIAFFQMVCRGARPQRNKTSFNIVDFQDNFANPRFRELLVKPVDLFYGAGAGRDMEVVSDIRLSRAPDPKPNLKYSKEHFFEEPPALFELNYRSERNPLEYQMIDGLRINQNQTFGIEFELAHSDPDFDFHDPAKWTSIAKTLVEFLRKRFGKFVTQEPLLNPEESSFAKWNVVFDGSCGWEIVTPILRGREGFEDIATFLHQLESTGTLDELGLQVNVRTGTHVHLGWRYGRLRRVQALMRFARLYEPALASLVSPSRINSQFCMPLRQAYAEKTIADLRSLEDFRALLGQRDARYVSLNMDGLRRRPQTIEVRLHNGTLDAPKILSWIALWMNIFHCVAGGRDDFRDGAPLKRARPLPTDTPDGDIVALAVERLGLAACPKMLGRLHQRRLEVTGNEHWRKELGHSTVAALLAHWQTSYERLTASE